MSSRSTVETQTKHADSQKTKGEGQSGLETHDTPALPRNQKGGDLASGEIQASVVPSPEHNWAGQSGLEVRDHHADPEVSAVCGKLVALSRRRTRIIQRERYVNQPSEQEYAAGILLRLPEGHGWDRKKLYVHAMKLRKIALKTISVELSNRAKNAGPDEYEKMEEMVGFALVAVDGELLGADVEVVAEMAYGIEEERQYLWSLGQKRKAIEKKIEALAKLLPVHGWWTSIRGCGSGGLGKLIGETGDLSNYSNPGKVWKRLGLAPFKGKAYSRHKAEKNLTTAEWVEAGYNPRRRSAMYTLGDALVKNGDEYRQIFLDRKRREIEKAGEDGLMVVTIDKSTVDNWRAIGLEGIELVKQYDPKAHRSAGHINMRAQRYMEKRLVRDLWKEWMKS